MAETPVIDESKLNEFGVRLFGLFETHKRDRKASEDRWLQNLRQFRGIYDPEVLALIGKDQSHAYPKMSRWKIIGTVARLMQMLFPNTEKNYGIRPSPLPDLSTAQLQEVLNTLVAAKAQGGDPSQVILTDEEIEKAVSKYADGKAERMELKVDDDLQEMEYITLARKVVFSATLYNIGILKGPLHLKTKARSWMRNQYTGAYTAQEVEKFKPLFEFLRVWDYYPDMTAQSLDKQDGTFERHVMTRQQIEELIQRPDFMGERIARWLNEHPQGNYTAQWWETIMKAEPKGDIKYASKEGRKYEVLSYWGGVTGAELRASGIQVADDELGKTFRADTWMIDNTVIKAKLAPFDGEVERYHVFVFEDDDLSLMGNGQADTLRDSQLSICETARAALDNMSVVGPMAIVNDDLLTPGQDVNIRKHKTWRVENLTGNQNLSAAVGNVNIESHLAELTALLQMFIEFADKESGLPPPSLGDVSGGGSEALRTQRNASMFLGAAALPIRDTVRNFDTFTISVIKSLVKWNMTYDPNPTRDGDFNVIARGSTSLIAKEVLAQNLEAFRAGITDDERPHIKVRKLLEIRAKANDIPVEDILEDEEVANATIQHAQQAQQQEVDLKEGLVRAQVEEILTSAMKHVVDAHKSDATMSVQAFEAIVAAIHGGLGLENEATKIAADAKKGNKPGAKK